MKSPEVGTDQRVTFRLRAPNAKEVAVSIGGKQLPMQKDEQGLWSLTTDPLAPDIYTYSLVVDGASMNDPSNRQAQTSFGGFQIDVHGAGTRSLAAGAGCRRAARSRVMRSIRPLPMTTATSSSTRRPATTRAARSRTRALSAARTGR